MSQQPKISKGTRVVVKGPNARFGRVVESHTTQAITQQPQPHSLRRFLFRDC